MLFFEFYRYLFAQVIDDAVQGINYLVVIVFGNALHHSHQLFFVGAVNTVVQPLAGIRKLIIFVFVSLNPATGSQVINYAV